MAKTSKTRASKQAYVSSSQLILEGFDSPFENKLDAENRWVQLAHKIPWDEIVSIYQTQMHNHTTGASNINPRVVIGSLVIKHMCNLSDEETTLQIQENIYMQYFIGYSSFCKQAPFDASLFVEIRKRLGVEQINAINDKIVALSITKKENRDQNDKHNDAQNDSSAPPENIIDKKEESPTHQGRLLVDATACPQDIAYPTDLNLLNDSREKAEKFIDILYVKSLHGKKKPRTYRHKAREKYLNTAMKRNKSRKEIRRAIRQQLHYVKRNLNHIENLHRAYPNGKTILNQRQQEYLLVIQHVYEQQYAMYTNKTHTIEDRIVSIHQPYVRPIKRGKQKTKTEFGAKIQLSLVAGYAFLDVVSWDAFNEGTMLLLSIENHKKRTGYYPQEVLADKIYCTRDNRKQLKELGIRLVAKPLGRPAVVQEHISPGERNPIEGKFGQAKTAYGLDKIKARLSETSQSWIASIIMVLNLVKLAGQVPFTLLRNMIEILLTKHYQQKCTLLFQ